MLRAFAFLWVLMAAAGCHKTVRKFDQPRACELALSCYFGIEGAHVNPPGGARRLPDSDPNDAGVSSFPGLFPDGNDKNVVDEVFGASGSCWQDFDGENAHGAVAQECEDRCKLLLWQDCADPLVPVDGGPFCGIDLACDPRNRPPCTGSYGKNAVTTCLKDSDCPAGDPPAAASDFNSHAEQKCFVDDNPRPGAVFHCGGPVTTGCPGNTCDAAPVTVVGGPATPGCCNLASVPGTGCGHQELVPAGTP